ncbi:MAG: ATP-binding protein [Candidatus Solibacter sp.]
MSTTVVAMDLLPRSRLDRMVAFCLDAGRPQVLAVSGLMIAGIAVADWEVGLDISLGILYILPMVLAAVVLTPRSIIGLAVVCATLRRLFENPHSSLETTLRFAFALLAYSVAGLFVVAVMRNRQEQALRIRAEEQLKTLVDSSPAGILTLDARGVVLAANNAVNSLFGLGPDQTMRGKTIEEYLPVLADALRLDTGVAPFRTSAQSQGRRESGEMFLADTWFSTYPTIDGRRLAAIVIDSSEEMRDREEQGLRQLSMNSRIMAGAMLHEVRNLCSAISTLYSNLVDRPTAGRSDELQGLDHLVKGLARIASLELHPRETESLEAVPLKDVLNDLRIILEPSWSETGGTTRWELLNEMPRVLADRHGLLQVFLNLAQNSQRAVQDTPVRELTVSVSTSADRAVVRFQDSGCGIPDPQKLFQPFQPGADCTGLGLYISRSLLRSYGGELRFEPRDQGACFSVDLLRVVQRKN